MKNLVYLIIGVLILTIVGGVVNRYRNGPVKNPAAVAPKGKGCVTVNGYFVCVNEETFNKVGRYAADNDMAAIQKLVDQKVVFMLKGGDEVYLADTHILSGAVEIRLPGSTDQFWTNIEAVKCE